MYFLFLIGPHIFLYVKDWLNYYLGFYFKSIKVRPLNDQLVKVYKKFKEKFIKL